MYLQACKMLNEIENRYTYSLYSLPVHLRAAFGLLQKSSEEPSNQGRTVVSLKGDKGMTWCSVMHNRWQHMKSNCVCVCCVCKCTGLLVKYHMNCCPPSHAMQFPFALTTITQKHSSQTISDSAIHALTLNAIKFFKPFCIDVPFPIGAIVVK